MKRLSKRDKRILIGGAALVALYLIVFHVVLPFLDAREQVQADLRKQEKLLQAAVRAIQEQDRYAAQLSQLSSVVTEYTAKLLDAHDSSSANAQLQQIVRDLAVEAKVSLVKTTSLQERKMNERYSKVTLQVTVDADMTTLTNFLHALSSHQKFLVVEDCYLNKFRGTQNQLFQPRMNVSGFIRL